MNSWKVSSASSELLQELRRKAGWWETLSGGTRRIEVIAGFGNSREAGLIPPLAAFLMNAHSDVRTAAQAAVERLITSLPVKQLIGFDDFSRGQWDGLSYDNPWRRLDAVTLGQFAANSEFGALAFASMHPNGRIREAAVKYLAQLDEGRELPFLLLRTNDWVKPVRELARKFTLDRLHPNYASAYLSNLPLILRLEGCRRVEHGELIDGVGRLLASDACRAVLEDGLRSEDRDTRLACLRFLNSGGNGARRDALIKALSDRDALIRLWAARLLLGTATGEEREKICDLLEKDRFMPIRREALQACLVAGGTRATAKLRSALFDRHRSIRDLARFHLRDELDAAATYREAIGASNGADLAVAIRGLGECGDKSDAKRLATYLDNPTVGIREAAVTAIGQLDARSHEESLRMAIVDTSARVSKAACAALEPLFPGKTDLQLYAPMLAAEPDPHRRRRILRLINHASKWVRISHLLAACRDTSAEVSEFAVAAMEICLRRYNRDFTIPTAA